MLKGAGRLQAVAKVDLSISSQTIDAPDRSFVDLLRDYVSLTKPRLSSLVLFTTAGGMWLADRPLSASTWICALVGTLGTVGSANALNCVIERHSDRFMRRTANRPLPAGRIGVVPALIFSVLLGVISVPLLVWGVNSITGILGLLSLLSYALVYTPLKARTHWAMIVGAIPGAIPPLMGWTAATNTVGMPALVVFSILFFWQLPHFIAIALFRKDEYAAAGLQSLPIAKGDDMARFHAAVYALILVPVSLLLGFSQTAGAIYLVSAMVLGAIFFFVGARGYFMRGDAIWARKFFATSLLYLVGLFAALGVDRLMLS